MRGSVRLEVFDWRCVVLVRFMFLELVALVAQLAQVLHGCRSLFPLVHPSVYVLRPKDGPRGCERKLGTGDIA